MSLNPIPRCLLLDGIRMFFRPDGSARTFVFDALASHPVSNHLTPPISILRKLFANNQKITYSISGCKSDQDRDKVAGIVEDFCSSFKAPAPERLDKGGMIQIALDWEAGSGTYSKKPGESGDYLADSPSSITVHSEVLTTRISVFCSGKSKPDWQAINKVESPKEVETSDDSNQQAEVHNRTLDKLLGARPLKYWEDAGYGPQYCPFLGS